MEYQMSRNAYLLHFTPYFLLFERHQLPSSVIASQMNQVVDLDSKCTWAKSCKKQTYTSFKITSKNYTPCHLPNLNPTVVISTWIPPLDYMCQVCHSIDDVDHMQLCDNCNLTQVL
ncbi:hypothetical protein Mp_6g00150 [Marchantia polymorpha subsp. ruderalis]|uniref:Uncharacterized protein n=2 Tax=Marchantia polymorpha TaxID=3197 RepID=A0AAF6BLY8_MARPO|nr:hypothetical protein MARPO_0164s0030 [Marchantia polymorpha]PTQ28445.1 hypothetical protein MARPO_0163s0006 [Marchantia polymorpha]BBN13022.1 hypothetical protein Mp_6g00150 [Marchantia polymorpha subsp. ruderalis]|eukprot:PTQ28437.1 hypothetical protein MARPO_0164s0030 [Marchantia polymorpha]